MINLLVEAGAKIDQMPCSGYTLIMAAVQRCCPCRCSHTVSRLLGLGADSNRLVDDSGPIRIEAIHIAAFRGLQDTVQILIDQGVNINGDARLAKQTDRLLRKSRTTDNRLPDLRGCKTPLELAIFKENGASVFEPTKTAATALLLVRAGAKLVGGEFARAPAFGDTTTHTMSLLQEFVSRGADVNELDQAGDSALHTAIRADSAGLVRYLLEIGVSYPLWGRDTPCHSNRKSRNR